MDGIARGVVRAACIVGAPHLGRVLGAALVNLHVHFRIAGL